MAAVTRRNHTTVVTDGKTYSTQYTPIDEWEGTWMSTELVDIQGRPYEAGQYVAKAYTSGRAVNIEVRRVREIRDGKLYLNESKVPIVFPGRMVILPDWDPETP